MAAFKEIKRRVVEESVRRGESVATGPISQRWVDGLTRAWEPQWRESPRLVNRFEITPWAKVMGSYMGEELRLKGLDGFAWGERPVWLRAKGSKRVLECVGNLAYAMQGMVALGEVSRSVEIAGVGEKLGGWVEFGRTRVEGRLREVAALDEVMELLVSAGVWSREEQKKRAAEASGPKGLVGDWEKTKWGWKYQGFPGWMQHPRVAMLVLTLAKLAVANPTLWGTSSYLDQKSAEYKLRMILSYFRGLDDDAELCWEMIRRHGLPKYEGGDVRKAWGTLGVRRVEKKGMWVREAELPPEWKESVWKHLLAGVGFPAMGGYERLVREVPVGWRKIENDPLRLFEGRVCREGASAPKVELVGFGSRLMEVPGGWWRKNRERVQGILGKPLRNEEIHTNNSNVFYVSTSWVRKKENRRKLREILAHGSLGVWKLEEVLEGKVVEEKQEVAREPRVKILFEGKWS